MMRNYLVSVIYGLFVPMSFPLNTCCSLCHTARCHGVARIHHASGAGRTVRVGWSCSTHTWQQTQDARCTRAPVDLGQRCIAFLKWLTGVSRVTACRDVIDRTPKLAESA